MLCAAVLMVSAVADTADAAPRRGRPFHSSKTFGIGIMLGAPTGFSGKYFYASDKAFDFGIGAIGYYRGREGLHLHFDHLWHPVNLASTPAFQLPLYLGIGARMFDFDDRDDFHGTVLGLRGPLGIAFDLNNTPLDIFLELALVMDFYVDDPYDDNVDVDVNGAVGIRYYFQ